MTAGYDALESDEKAMLDDEHVRLLYVAATRAMDHLVLSVYRTLKGVSDASYIADHFEGQDEMWRKLPDPAEEGLMTVSKGGSDQSADDMDVADHSREARKRWIEARSELIARQGRPNTVAATRLAEVAIRRDQGRAGERRTLEAGTRRYTRRSERSTPYSRR